MHLCIWPMWANGWWLRAAPNWLASHFASHTTVTIKGVQHSKQNMFKRALCHLFIKQTYELRISVESKYLPSFHLFTTPVGLESNAQLCRSKLPTCSERQGRLEHLEHLGHWRSVHLVLEVNSQVMPSCSPKPKGCRMLKPPRESWLFTQKKCYKNSTSNPQPSGSRRVECFHNLPLITMLVCALSHFAPFSSL